MQINDEVLEFTLDCLFFYLENNGGSKRFASAEQAECELWDHAEDPKVNDSSTFQLTKTSNKAPRSFELIEWMKGDQIQHFEMDAGKVTSKNPKHSDKDARVQLFEYALEIMAFSRAREFKGTKKA